MKRLFAAKLPMIVIFSLIAGCSGGSGGGGSNSSSNTSGSTNNDIVAWTLLKIPDTGQTMRHSAAFGDDADYTINPPSYTDNGNGTITDNVTTLMWQKQDDAITRTWETAGTYCTGLSLGGHADWRLPNDIELMSIVNYGQLGIMIDYTYFPNTQAGYYWSSTKQTQYPSYAWDVDFLNGYVSYDGKANTYYSRCVRGGQ